MDAFTKRVMAGPVPAIHVFLAFWSKDVDARHKAGHDEINSLQAVTSNRKSDRAG
jgi:hypothetical protein